MNHIIIKHFFIQNSQDYFYVIKVLINQFLNFFFQSIIKFTIQKYFNL